MMREIFSASTMICALAALGTMKAQAGPNAAAAMRVDAVYLTPAVDTLSSVTLGANFRVSVRVEGTRYLDGYSFLLGYDTTRAAFVRAQADRPGDGLVNILATRGGTPVLFIGQLSRDTSKVSVAYNLQGGDSTRSPSGAGLLAVLEFRAKAAGAARFTVTAAQLLDWRRTADSVVSLHAAVVNVSPPVRLLLTGAPGSASGLLLLQAWPVWTRVTDGMGRIDPLGRRVSGAALLGR